ncbi:MAG TPA: c-type cytochrome [Actinomycetota bacterium]|nr:c-type cytochrome [Actinomycetota bacterium]
MVLRSPLAAAMVRPRLFLPNVRDVYERRCASCHSPEGNGGEGLGPSLIGVGAAEADYQLRTGRLPLQNPEAQAVPTPVLGGGVLSWCPMS